MLKKLRVIMIALCICACALAFAACDMGGGNSEDNRLCVTYHTNGGYIGGDENETSDYVREIEPDEIADYKPATARKDTWLFGGWFTDELCNNEFDPSMLEELAGEDKNLDLYAKWVDTVTVTKKNFTEFFSVYSRWNGGATIGNAAITYEFKPKMILDPAFSAEQVEISVTPVLTNNNQTVWSGETKSIFLTREEDYRYFRRYNLPSSAANIEFNMLGKTLDWELVTPSFEIKLLHRVPLTVTLELNGGACEKSELTVAGGDVLSKDDLPVPVKSGHRFTGWFADSELETEYDDKVITCNKTLYAKFEREITVTFYSNGGTEKEPLKLLKGEFIAPGEKPVKEDYKFFGWYTDEDFAEGSKFDNGFAGDEDLNLYARWERMRTIEFNSMGGTEIEPIEIADTEVPKIFVADILSPLYSPEKSGLEFGGWYTDAEYKNKYVQAPVSGDLTLYARWLKRVLIPDENLKDYFEISITHEKNDNALEITVTASLKEQYRNYDFNAIKTWEVNCYDDSGKQLRALTCNNTAIDTSDGKSGFSSTVTIEKNDHRGGYDATVFEIQILHGNSAYMLVPENELQAK